MVLTESLEPSLLKKIPLFHSLRNYIQLHHAVNCKSEAERKANNILYTTFQEMIKKKQK